jgi:hypothetical protein
VVAGESRCMSVVAAPRPDENARPCSLLRVTRCTPAAPCASGCRRARSRSPCGRRPRPARRSRSGRSAS